MTKIILASFVALTSACSMSGGGSQSGTSSKVESIPDIGSYNVLFASKNRCLTSPNGSDISGSYVTGSNPFQHMPCAAQGQSFLFKGDEIKTAGALGAYVSEASGKILAGAASRFSVLKNAAGQLVVQSQVSGKCLVAGANSAVVLGACDDVNAAVSIELEAITKVSPGAAGTVACSVDNQGNAEDCI